MITMRAVLLGLVLALAACGSRSNAPAIDTGGVTPWSAVLADDIGMPEGVAYTQTAVQGATVAQIAGVPDAAASTGVTGGVSIRLPAELEARASGQRVQVTVRALSPQDGALLGVAYSTNEVGNSGWQRFVLGAQPRDYAFAYNVAPSQARNGDYLGFRSYGDGVVQIVGYRIDIIPEPAAPQPAAP